MSSYTQAYGAYHQQQPRGYPPVHQPPSSASSASWGPPPFAGPPPLPAGIQVNPQQWQSGYWQYNNYYKPSSAPIAQQQHVPWIPSHNWMPQNQKYPYQQQQQQKQYQSYPAKPPQQQPAAQQASYNPYKRQPRAPSEEYLKDPLVDNPLGLIDAQPVSVEEYYRKGHTPWIWQPTPLEPDSDDPQSGQQKRNATDPAKQSNGASAPPAPSRRYSESDVGSEPESFTSKIVLQPTFSSKIIRTPEHYRNNSLSNTPTSSPRNTRSPVDSLGSRFSHLSTGSSSSSPSSSLSRHSSMPNTSSTSSFSSVYSASPSKPDYSSAPMLTDRLSDEPESILSPLIFSKTPGPAAPNQLRTLRNHPNPLLSTQSLDTIPEATSPPHAHAQAPYPHNQQQQQTNGSSTAAQQQQQPSSFYPRSGLQHAHTVPTPPKSQVTYTSTAPPPPQLPPPRIPIYPSANGAPAAPSAPATGISRTDREQEAEREHEAERVREREKKWEQEREQDKLQRAIARERQRMQNGEYGRHNQHRDEWDRERERAEREQREKDKERIGSRYTTYVDPHINSSPGSHTDSRSSSSSESSSAHPSPMRRSSSYSTPPTTANSTYPNSSPSNQHPNAQSQPLNGYASPHSHSYSSYSQPHHSSHSQSPQAQTTTTPNTSSHAPQPHPSSSLSTSTTITSPSNPSKLSNPLPPPPQIVQRTPVLPVQRTPPPKWRERVRYGFWNRRGDHLTPDGYIVYAPIDKAYPTDLQNHPKEEDGYENHERLFTSYVQRPELPQSLPKHGKLPECPYEAFIVYHYKQ